MGDGLLIDPASRENWIDAPLATAPYLFAPPADPPDELDLALDALAKAIGEADGGERTSIASCLARPSIFSRAANVLSQLPSSRLMAFLDRLSRHGPTVAALMPCVAASGAADRMGRAQLFRRLTAAARLYALQRACNATTLNQTEARP
jgi:hypothetical protein